ncbi:MAG: hypothetical protein RL077_2600, partial [Verrucomicrobiota bacterium]
EHGILRGGRGRFSFVLVLPSQEPAQGIARLVILGRQLGLPQDVFDAVIAPDANRAILRPQPASPVAGLKFLELIPRSPQTLASFQPPFFGWF